MKKGMVLATAVAASLMIAACSQKPPRPGSAEMVKSAHSCQSVKAKSHRCNANTCKANQCKAG